MKELILEMEDYAQEKNVPIIEKKSIAFIMKYIKDNNVKNILEHFLGINDAVSGTGSSLDGLKSKDIDVGSGKAPQVVGDYALETTLQGTNSILELIFDAITDDDGGKLASTLEAATKELRDVANGLVQHQKSQKADTREASARIADPAAYKQISDVARNAASKLGE